MLNAEEKFQQDLVDECAVKRRIVERGYAFVQVLLEEEWVTVGIKSSYQMAQRCVNRLCRQWMNQNHRLYKFRIQ